MATYMHKGTIIPDISSPVNPNQAASNNHKLSLLRVYVCK